MTGMFNVYNAIAAASCAMVLGISHEDIKAGLEHIANVPGRIEMLPTDTPYRVILDYAHAPDALDNILRTCREFTRGRLIALFGCGGDRDRTKRPLMGKAAADWADFVIVTTDNPRTEKPGDIIADILPGLEGSGTSYVVVEDRIEAIHYAMDNARSGDVIVLCGKGHETYQEINHEKFHMDEREIVADYLK
jgi:UDP-N-acetylmuramoyl-L-alanyl-D-glutamate--2,6-diaminopimelate ligase